MDHLICYFLCYILPLSLHVMKGLLDKVIILGHIMNRNVIIYFDYFQTILNRQDRWYHKWTVVIVTRCCVLYIVAYIDAISINSPFIYMICQALPQPSYTFVHSLYIFCHYHDYKPTFLYISELINVFIYLVTYRPIRLFVCVYM